MGKLVLTRLQGALNAGVVMGYQGERAHVRMLGRPRTERFEERP